MISRFAEKDLKQWLNKKDRHPLILRGARQVGKSTLVRNFAYKNGLTLIEINFETRKLKSLESESFTVEDIFLEIEAAFKIKVTEKTLIFFDEIQEQAKALMALRYFYEQSKKIPVIAAGSLLEFTLKEADFSFPVGRVQFYHLGPMTFLEFLYALKENTLAEQLEKAVFKDFLHDRYLELLRKYYFIGGMPEAVRIFSETKSLEEVRQVHQRLVQTYKADFPKYGKRINVERVAKIFEAAALQIGRKIIYQNFDRESKAREIKKALELLIDARVLLACTHTQALASPIRAGSDSTIQKLFFLDIGLMNAMQGLDWNTLNSNFESFLSTKGVISEQFVAQHLAFIEGGYEEPSLFYWLRDKSNAKAEIDFIWMHKGKILPIEVKSESHGRMKSLLVFLSEKKLKDAIKLSFAPLTLSNLRFKTQTAKGLQEITFNLKSIPIYAVEKLKEWMD